MKMIAFLTLQIQDLQPNWRTAGSATYQYLIVLGAVVVVSLLVTAWVLYFRKQHHHHPHQHPHGHHHEWGKNPDAQKVEVVAEQPHQHHKGRRRRAHRPRNPTLAETGGLPPVRSRSSDDPIP